MRQRPLLSVTILYETPLDPDLCKKLLAYFKPYEHATPIEIKGIHSVSKIIRIPRASWNPAFDTEFTYFIRTPNQLYDILLKLIDLALKLLNEIGYHDIADTLTILVPFAPNDDLSYTFKWRLLY